MAEPARWIDEADELRELSLPEREDGKPWPAQGDWTYEDYLLLPADGRRYEVLHGVLHVTPAPSYDHQRSVSKLDRSLGTFVDTEGLGEVLVAPFDVKLPAGITNPVEPDLVFFRTGQYAAARRQELYRVPDLIAEVLSPEAGIGTGPSSSRPTRRLGLRSTGWWTRTPGRSRSMS